MQARKEIWRRNLHPMTVKSFAELKLASNDVGVQFVFNELELAQSFLDVAAQSNDPQHQSQSCRNAKKAHDTAVRFLPRFVLSESQKSSFSSKLHNLAKRLEEMEFRLTKNGRGEDRGEALADR
jgi:hypothetical protein